MADGIAYNFITERLISVRVPGLGDTSLTLPGVLLQLADGEIVAFSALRRHQRQPWFCFLAQLAAIVLEGQGVSMAEAALATEGDWAGWLRDLSGGRDEAWSLVVEDLQLPAIFQAPVPEGRFAKVTKKGDDKAWDVKQSPDEIDYLVTAKVHDVKPATATAASPQQWLFGLCSVQTSDGFGGATIYGIARMNGGYASRASISHVPEGAWGPHWRRDVALLLGARESIAEEQGLTGSKGLLWLEPWDGTTSLDLAELDPYFVEICRRIRMVDQGGVLRARSIGTEAKRLNAEERNGRVGDPWLPVATKDGKALTIGEQGFDYKKVVDLMCGGTFAHGHAYAAVPGDVALQCQVLARGQGQTNGLHERRVQIPPKLFGRLRGLTSGDPLAQRARDRVELAGLARKSVLRPALLKLQQAGTDKLKADAKTADSWTALFDQRVDQAFFDQLWQDADLDGPTADAQWKTWLLAACEAVLEAAIAATPYSGVRRYRAIAAAESMLQACAIKNQFRLSTAKLAEENAQ
jgi:CRISPR system Cascade subunit CasA